MVAKKKGAGEAAFEDRISGRPDTERSPAPRIKRQGECRRTFLVR